MRPNQTIKRYTISIITFDKEIKPIYTGNLGECIDTAIHLIREYCLTINKIILIDCETNKLINLKHKARMYSYKRNIEVITEPIKRMPWDKGYRNREK